MGILEQYKDELRLGRRLEVILYEGAWPEREKCLHPDLPGHDHPEGMTNAKGIRLLGYYERTDWPNKRLILSVSSGGEYQPFDREIDEKTIHSLVFLTKVTDNK
jgi:hypothetical protein